MWPPPNIRSLPSKEEIQKAKEEISTIELEIVEAELRLDALRKSLSERRAWIAPIRTIPPEILSLVFTEASKANWQAPLVLQRVSRQWRDVVVYSAEAWTFIPLFKHGPKHRSELISLFLERSRNAPLHILVRDDSLLGYMDLLADRIKCFNLKVTTRSLLNCYLQHGRTFHRLERLRIETWWDRDEDTPPTDDPAAWDMLSFPNLKVLHIRSKSSSLLGAISAAPELPAVQHLTVRCPDIWRPLDLITRWAMSLESVDLTYGSVPSGGLDTGHKLHFPRLRYLKLWDLSHGAGTRLRFNAATPNLQAHLDEGTNPTSTVVKVDTDSVVLLHVSRTPDLSRYPRLAALYFSGLGRQGEEVIGAIKCLQDNPTLCPDLALIEYTTLTEEQMAKAKDALMARGEVNGHIIQLTSWNLKLWQERMQALRVLEAVRFLSSLLVLLLTA